MSTLELPETVFRILLNTATSNGISPVEWIAAHLPTSLDGLDPAVHPEPSAAEIDEANVRLRATRVGPGWSTSLDNESIDADLIREYSDSHSGPSR